MRQSGRARTNNIYTFQNLEKREWSYLEIKFPRFLLCVFFNIANLLEMKFYFFSFSLTRNCYYYDDDSLGLLRLRETRNALRLPVFFF